MIKNTASQKISVFAFDYSTGAPKTGDAANLTVYVSKDDGSVTALTDTSATEADATNAKGDYLFDLTQAETNATKLRFTGKSSTSNVVIVPQTIYTSQEATVVAGVADLQTSIAALSTPTQIADALLDRDMSTGTDSGSTTVRTPRQALRLLRNKAAIAGGTLTVKKEDDVTTSWTAAVATTAGDPVSSIDPAGP